MRLLDMLATGTVLAAVAAAAAFIVAACTGQLFGAVLGAGATAGMIMVLAVSDWGI